VKYPHFVKPKSELKDHWFTSFYMPDEDIRRIKEAFPNGCNSRFSVYTITIEGKSLIDWMAEITPPRSPARREILYAFERLKEKNQPLLCDWGDLVHSGYWPMWDENFTLLCGKGKIKANEHTVIKLLKHNPKWVQSLFNEIIENYVLPLRQVIEKRRNDNERK